MSSFNARRLKAAIEAKVYPMTFQLKHLNQLFAPLLSSPLLQILLWIMFLQGFDY